MYAQCNGTRECTYRILDNVEATQPLIEKVIRRVTNHHHLVDAVKEGGREGERERERGREREGERERGRKI